MLINMKQLILTFSVLFLLSSCSSLSYDDQLASLSSETNLGTSIVKVYNREKGDNDVITIKIDSLENKTVSIDPQQVATILIDAVDGSKKHSVLLFGLPVGKTTEKKIDVKPEDKVFFAVENSEVFQLSEEEWYSKLNKDRELTSTEKVMVVVFSPIIVPVALVSIMVLTLADGVVELWES